MPWPGDATDLVELQRVLVARVNHIYIEGVLTPSLEELAPIQLHLETRPDAVAQAFVGAIERRTPARSRVLPTVLFESKFETAADGLLILGEPGAGKTTLLLQLADKLLSSLEDAFAAAERDTERNARLRIPVVFPLSTWATQRKPITEWLVDMLEQQYRFSRRHAQKLVGEQCILPMLDALDEVPAEHRSACAAQIAAFRQKFDLVPVVVSCRAAEYDRLGTRLPLERAIAVLPLTPEQVSACLLQADPPRTELLAALDNDAGLREIADTPLMLSIMAASFEPGTNSPPHPTGSIEERRTWLFTRYVNHVLGRPPQPTVYSLDKTSLWLSWLALQLASHNQKVFQLEMLQWDWVFSQRQKSVVNVLASIALGCVMGGLAWRTVSNPLVWLFAAFSGMTIGRRLLGGQFQPLDNVRWSLSRAVRRFQWQVATLLVVMYLIIGFAMAAFGLSGDVVSGRTIGVILGLGSAAVIFIVGGVATDVASSKLTPYEAIRRSAKTAAISTLVVSSLAAVPIGFMFAMVSPRIEMVAFVTLPLAVFVGIFAGFYYGGRACLEHFLIRAILWRTRVAPWQYGRFLEFGVGRVLLRRVGGGYMFLHPLLRDHFAAIRTVE